jgi:hypothetical protein
VDRALTHVPAERRDDAAIRSRIHCVDLHQLTSMLDNALDPELDIRLKEERRGVAAGVLVGDPAIR